MAFEHALEAAAILTRNDAFSRKDVLNALQQSNYEDSIAKLSELKNVSKIINPSSSLSFPLLLCPDPRRRICHGKH